MSSKEEMIEQFMQVTGTQREVAEFYLESAKWDLETATSLCLTDNDNENIDSHDIAAVEEETNTATGSVSINNLNAMSHQTKRKPKNDGNIVTLSSMKRNESDDDEENDERGQAFYVGGSEHGGGQQVIGPARGKKPNLDELFKSAQDHGAEIVSSMNEVDVDTGHNSRKVFSGSGYRLGDSSQVGLPSAPTIPGQATDKPREVEVRVRLFSNGFTVDDGPLRSLTDVQNREFLTALGEGRIPQELVVNHKLNRINLNMENRMGEEYEPSKFSPKQVAFQGVGRMLGSPTPKLVEDTSNENIIRNEQNIPLEPVELDESQPITQLQIRLADNSRLIGRFNHYHTVDDIRRHIVSSRPQYATERFTLWTAYPHKQLDSCQQSLADSNLLNAVIVQKLI